MNKGLIITGPPASGKSMFAKWIADLNGEKNTVWVNGRERDLHWAISNQLSDHPNGALLIIDDLADVSKLAEILHIPTTGVRVEPQGKWAFDIPADKIKLIVTIPHPMEEMNANFAESVLRRFDIIHTVTRGHVIGLAEVQQRRNLQLTADNSKKFISWASWFYTSVPGRLGKGTPLNDAFESFKHAHPELRLTPKMFIEQLRTFCEAHNLYLHKKIRRVDGKALNTIEVGYRPAGGTKVYN